MECFSKKASLSTIDSTGNDAALQQIKFEPTDKRQTLYSFGIKLPIISSAALMLAACGGGGGDESPSTSSGNTSSGNTSSGNTSSGNTSSGNTGSGNTGSSNTGPDSSKPTQKPNNPSTFLTDTNAARFLQQAQFSSTKAEIESLKSIGIHQWLNNQFAMPIAITGYDWLLQRGINDERYLFNDNAVDWMAWQQLFSSKDTLRKRTALALSEIMVMSAHGITLPLPAFSIASYWDVLNEHAFGNFRDLLKAITLNVGMGGFLDLMGSKKANDRGRRPDENYAREVMQLFTIGLVELNLDGTPRLSGGKPIETYTQQTVTNVAQALTGWDVDWSYDTSSAKDPSAHRAPMINFSNNHDSRSVSFFGVTVPAGASGEQALDMVIDALFNHANVAPFISKQLIQRLVTSNPSPDYVRRVATMFNSDDKGMRGNLRSVLKAILTDIEARRPPSKNVATIGKVREPIVRYIQWVHTFTNRKSLSGEWAVSNTESSQWRFNQSPFKGRSVFNFFDADYAPSTSDFVNNNLVAPELQLHNETSTAGYINFMSQVVEDGVPYAFDESRPEILPEYSEEMKLYDQPEKLVAHLNLTLCANQMSDDTIALIVEALEDITDRAPDWGKNRICLAVLLTMASPDYLVQK